MEIIRLIALILSLSLILISCSPSPKKLLSYQEESFRAIISWQIDPLKISAILTHHTPDTISLEFTSPPALSGITVKKCGEETVVILDDIEFKSDDVCRFAEVFKIFQISAALKKSSVESLSGIKLNRIELFDNIKNEIFVLYLYKDSSIPRKILAPIFGKEITFDIISFEFIS